MPRKMLAVLLLLSAGCYHASIETGMKPGTDRIEKEWAASFVFGLVPPDTIDAQSKCKSGVSKVETQHSFLNALVAFFTIQIYTPMDLTVTCAAGPGASLEPSGRGASPQVAVQP
ncbi:MAG TPA: Bor family protein [Myxococcaceae bacterium]|nr:Bor family protein [Myxococcaceae bacterium]